MKSLDTLTRRSPERQEHRACRNLVGLQNESSSAAANQQSVNTASPMVGAGWYRI